MPIFEYICPFCGKRDERILPRAEADTQICAYCHEMLNRQISAPASFPVGKYGKGGGLKPEKSE